MLDLQAGAWSNGAEAGAMRTRGWRMLEPRATAASWMRWRWSIRRSLENFTRRIELAAGAGVWSLGHALQ
jgi:hypothetical protein